MCIYISVYTSIAKFHAHTHPGMQNSEEDTSVLFYCYLSYLQGSFSATKNFHFLAGLVASKLQQSAVSCLQNSGVTPDMHFMHLAIVIKKESKNIVSQFISRNWLNTYPR